MFFCKKDDFIDMLEKLIECLFFKSSYNNDPEIIEMIINGYFSIAYKTFIIPENRKYIAFYDNKNKIFLKVELNL